MPSSTAKGDQLEAQFYGFLLDQKERGELVYGLYPPELSEIHHKKKYFCQKRNRNVEFDIVIEIRTKCGETPHLYVIFECKNYKKNVEENRIADFSSKLSDIFRHNAKGVIVTRSNLQSGGHSLAVNSGIGIVKFIENGLEIVANRLAQGVWDKPTYLQSQFFNSLEDTQPLKFIALYDGRLHASVGGILTSFSNNSSTDNFESNNRKAYSSVPFLTEDNIASKCEALLNSVNYECGAVNLEEVCERLDIRVVRSPLGNSQINGKKVLGSADFYNRQINIYEDDIQERERFTLAHEIGHFALDHDQYIKFESVSAHDIRELELSQNSNDFDRLEYQANLFASNLLMPDFEFRNQVAKIRADLDIRYKGSGYIYVDNQPCNILDYQKLLTLLSLEFDVSKTAAEIRMKRYGMIADNRDYQKY